MQVSFVYTGTNCTARVFLLFPPWLHYAVAFILDAKHVAEGRTTMEAWCGVGAW